MRIAWPVDIGYHFPLVFRKRFPQKLNYIETSRNDPSQRPAQGFKNESEPVYPAGQLLRNSQIFLCANFPCRIRRLLGLSFFFGV